MNWTCDSDRCQIKQCDAEVKALVNRQASSGFLPVEPVSYTHLDVYKRQGWEPAVDFRQLVRIMVDADMEQLQQGQHTPRNPLI